MYIDLQWYYLDIIAAYEISDIVSLFVSDLVFPAHEKGMLYAVGCQMSTLGPSIKITSLMTDRGWNPYPSWKNFIEGVSDARQSLFW